ncbi:hypothetical protein TYRP_001207 [Tyrophagus putrescentiae]|nr:hypothetical protein TYRP_001207 [Tyrophagus putrescentiae]
MFIALFAIFVTLLLVLTFAIVNCADTETESVNVAGNDRRNDDSEAPNFQTPWSSNIREDGNYGADASLTFTFTKQSKMFSPQSTKAKKRKYFKKVNKERHVSPLVSLSSSEETLSSRSSTESSPSEPRVAPLRMSQSVKNQVVINDPQLFYKARTTKCHGMILVDNQAYHDALKEGKAAGLAFPSDSEFTNHGELTKLVRAEVFKEGGKGGSTDSAVIAQRTQSFTPAPSKASKVIKSKAKVLPSAIKGRGAKKSRKSTFGGGSTLKKRSHALSSKVVARSLKSVQKSKKSRIKSSKSKNKSVNQSMVTRRSKELK